MNERIEETNVRAIRLYYRKVLLMRPFVRLRRKPRKTYCFRSVCEDDVYLAPKYGNYHGICRREARNMDRGKRKYRM